MVVVCPSPVFLLSLLNDDPRHKNITKNDFPLFLFKSQKSGRKSNCEKRRGRRRRRRFPIFRLGWDVAHHTFRLPQQPALRKKKKKYFVGTHSTVLCVYINVCVCVWETFFFFSFSFEWCVCVCVCRVWIHLAAFLDTFPALFVSWLALLPSPICVCVCVCVWWNCREATAVWEREWFLFGFKRSVDSGGADRSVTTLSSSWSFSLFSHFFHFSRLIRRRDKHKSFFCVLNRQPVSVQHRFFLFFTKLNKLVKIKRRRRNCAGISVAKWEQTQTFTLDDRSNGQLLV